MSDAPSTVVGDCRRMFWNRAAPLGAVQMHLIPSVAAYASDRFRGVAAALAESPKASVLPIELINIIAALSCGYNTSSETKLIHRIMNSNISDFTELSRFWRMMKRTCIPNEVRRNIETAMPGDPVAQMAALVSAAHTVSPAKNAISSLNMLFANVIGGVIIDNISIVAARCVRTACREQLSDTDVRSVREITTELHRYLNGAPELTAAITDSCTESPPSPQELQQIRAVWWNFPVDL